MKIKRPGNIEFQAFKDGKCRIYALDEEDNKIIIKDNICFDNRVLGYKRAYAAQSVDSNINRVIRIPFIQGIDNKNRLDVYGEEEGYIIDLMQDLTETNPPSIELTLKKVGGHSEY